MFVGAFVAHDADALHRQQYHAGLPDVIVQAVLAHLGDEDVVGVLQYAHFLGGDFAQYAHGQAGAREGVAAYQMLGHAQLPSDGAYFVLEERAQRFAQLQVHFLGQSADVVVALDGGAGDAQRLYAVGVYCALRQPFDILDFAGFLIEDVDEALADDFALGLRVGDSGQFVEEFGRGIDAYDVEAQPLVVA